MKKNFFLRYWPITAVMLTMIISNFLLAAFVLVQPTDPDSTQALQQATPLASPVPQQTMVIPNTGGSNEQIYFDIFARVPWLFMGMVLLFVLFFLMARSGNKDHQHKI